MIQLKQAAILLIFFLILKASYAQTKVLENWPNENKKIQGQYNILGVEDGKWLYWHENGNLKEESHYVNGIYHGKVAYWYENGNKQDEGYFKKGFRDSINELV